MPRALVPVSALILLTALGTVSAAEIVKLKPTDVLYGDDKGVGLREPYAVGCSATSIVIADSGSGRLVVYSVSGRTVRATASIALPEIPFPVRVAILRSGKLLALDGRSRKIARLAASGELEEWVELSGGAAPVAIRSFAVDDSERIWILDVGGSKVLVVDASGRVERTVAFAKDAGSPADLAVDDRGDVYVVDSVRRRVDVARKDDTELKPLTASMTQDMDFPTALTVDAEGNIFVVDENGGGVVVVGRDGSFRGRQLAMGWKDGLLRYPSGACLVAGSVLVIADRGNNRAQLFSVGR